MLKKAIQRYDSKYKYTPVKDESFSSFSINRPYKDKDATRIDTYTIYHDEPFYDEDYSAYFQFNQPMESFQDMDYVEYDEGLFDRSTRQGVKHTVDAEVQFKNRTLEYQFLRKTVDEYAELVEAMCNGGGGLLPNAQEAAEPSVIGQNVDLLRVNEIDFEGIDRSEIEQNEVTRLLEIKEGTVEPTEDPPDKEHMWIPHVGYLSMNPKSLEMDQLRNIGRLLAAYRPEMFVEDLSSIPDEQRQNMRSETLFGK
jgi:hypothetical protein